MEKEYFRFNRVYNDPNFENQILTYLEYIGIEEPTAKDIAEHNNEIYDMYFRFLDKQNEQEIIKLLSNIPINSVRKYFKDDIYNSVIKNSISKQDSDLLLRDIPIYNEKDEELFKSIIKPLSKERIRQIIIDCATDYKKLDLIYEAVNSSIILILNTTIDQNLKKELIKKEILYHNGGIVFSNQFPTNDFLDSIDINSIIDELIIELVDKYSEHKEIINKCLEVIKETLDNYYFAKSKEELQPQFIKMVENKIFFAFRYLTEENQSKVVDNAIKNGMTLEDISDLNKLPFDVIKIFLKHHIYDAIFYQEKELDEAEIKYLILNTGTKYLSNFSPNQIEKIQFSPVEQEVLKGQLEEDPTVIIFLKDLLEIPENVEKYMTYVSIPHKYIYSTEYLKYTAIHNKEKFIELMLQHKEETGKPIFKLNELSSFIADILQENIDLLNLIDDSYTEKKEQIKDAIVDHINESFDKEEAIIWLINHDYDNEASICAKKIIKTIDDTKYLKYIKDYDKQTIDTILSWLKDDIRIIFDHRLLLNIKPVVIYAMQFVVCKDVYKILSQELKEDYDVNKAYVISYKENIDKINHQLPYYNELKKEAILKYPELFSKYPEFNKDIDLYQRICHHNPSSFIALDRSLQTRDNYELLQDYNLFEFPVKLIIHCLNNKVFDLNNEKLQNSLLNYFRYSSNDIVNLEYNEELYNFLEDKFKTNFNYILRIYLNNDNLVPEKYRNVIQKAQGIMSQTGKYNVTENYLFTYDLVNTIYPNMGIIYTLDLLKYDTKAANNLAQLLNDNYLPLIKQYLNLLKQAKIIPEDDMFIHTAFANFYKVKNLVINMLNNYEDLTNEDMYLFKEVLYNPEFIEVNNLTELRDSKQIIIDKLQASNVDNEIIYNLFGYKHKEDLRSVFREYQLDNFIEINKIHKELTKKGINSKKYRFTNKEIEIIIIISKLLKENNSNIQKQIVKKYYEKYNNISLKAELDNIIDKITNLYSLYINEALTKINTDKIEKVDGVKIIKFNGKPFNFLVHKIHVFQDGLEDFSNRIIDNPERLFDMYGSNLISTSAINEKNQKVLRKDSPNEIILVYSDIKEGSFVCMGPDDQGINRGLMQEKTVGLGSPLTDLKSLNRQTKLRMSNYNEVGLRREGNIPSAILCFNEMTPEAKLFAIKLSKVLNKDIPVIIIDEKSYEEQNENEYNNAKAEIKNRVTTKYINEIMYTSVTGLREFKYDIYDMVINILNQFNDKKISFTEAIQLINHIQQNCLMIHCNTKNPAYIITNSFKHVLAELYQKANGADFKIIANINEKDEIEYTYIANNKQYRILFDYNLYKQRHEPEQIVLESCVTNLESLLNPNIVTECELIGVNKHNLLKEKNTVDEIKDINKLSNQNIETLIREFIISFIYGNFSQTIDDFCLVDGKIKRKSLPKIDSIELNESYKPDFSYNPHHKRLIFQDIINNLDSSNVRIINETIAKLESFDDDSFYALFKDYFELSKIKLNYKKLLNSRRNNCILILNNFVEQIEKESIYGK